MMRLITLVTVVLVSGGRVPPVFADPPSAEELARMRAAAPAQPPAKPTRPRRLLVYTDCRGFVHSAVPYGAAALRILGEQSGAFDAVESQDPEVFRPDSLRGFDAVCLENTTGELFTDPALKESLLAFVRAGGGLVGIHAATDCFYEWPEFGQLMGGYFAGHPWNEEVTLKAVEPDHPVTKMFGRQPFEVADEIYQFRDPYSRDHLRVLLVLDPQRTDMHKPGITRRDGDFAVSWVRNYGLGRVFYCSLGHRHEIFWNPTVLQHYLAGIQFALGDLPACAVASNRLTGDGWIDLSAGSSLAGWICKPGAWTIEQGVLARAGGGDIWTEQAFGDFVLDLDFKISPQGNSGIFFRTGDVHDCVQTGIELQVLDSHGKAEVGPHDCGAIYDCLAPRVNAVKPAGEWNHVQLACRGPRITAKLNGEPIIDMDLDRWTTAGQNPDGSPNKFKTAYRDMPRSGRIGFQDHGNPVWYRNVRVQRLD